MPVVKHRSVAVTVYPWEHPSGRQYWRFKAGGKHVTRASLEDAKEAAKDYAKRVYRGQLDLNNLTIEQSRACRQMIEADPSCRMIEEFLRWHKEKRCDITTTDAVDKFIASKTSNQGESGHNVKTLKHHTAKLPPVPLAEVTPMMLNDRLDGSPRTRRNTIAAWKTFFRWCQRQGWLPHGEPTAAEKLDTPIITRGAPTTWTPDELKTLLKNVRPEYLPWMALSAFAGLRAAEVCPSKESNKPPLSWSDIHWDRGIIEVSPETSKTGRRRVIPILPALRAWLELCRDRPISPAYPPHQPIYGRGTAETARLGKLVGGWRKNALRHSFISYRAAVVGVAQAALEAGNSESESRRSYHDAKSADQAAAWFSVFPECSPD